MVRRRGGRGGQVRWHTAPAIWYHERGCDCSRVLHHAEAEQVQRPLVLVLLQRPNLWPLGQRAVGAAAQAGDDKGDLDLAADRPAGVEPIVVRPLARRPRQPSGRGRWRRERRPRDPTTFLLDVGRLKDVRARDLQGATTSPGLGKSGGTGGGGVGERNRAQQTWISCASGTGRPASMISCNRRVTGL